jgi:hypothetical protein
MSRRIGGLLAALALVVGGCLDPQAPSAAPTPTRSPDPTPAVATYRLGVSVWYEGLVLHFDQAAAVLDARGGPVEVTLRIQNPNDDTGVLDAPIRLAVGSMMVEPNRDSVIPDVAPQGSATIVLTYELQGIASIDDAAIEVGATPLHVARVPMRPAPGEDSVFEPVPIAVSGANTAADLKVTLRTGLLRWDLPDWSEETDAKLAILILTYDVTYAGDFPGGISFTGENVALRLPDGTIVEERRDGHSQSVELIGPKKTKRGLSTRFEIPFGTRGKVALVVKNGSTQKLISFTIGG